MKRLLSWLLVLAMVFSILPMSAFAAETDVEIGGGDSDFDVEFGGELNPIDLTADLRADMTATVTVPAGKTFSYLAYGIANGMEMTINGETTVVSIMPGAAYTWEIANTGAEDAEYVITIGFPAGHEMNPVVIENMNWYSDEVTQTLGDRDGYFYTYTATETGTVTLYFNAVYDENDEVVENVGIRDIMVTNMNTYAQFSLQQDGVDNYGLELNVPVQAGQQLLINTAWVKDAEGNMYPAATYSWTGNFSYPVGSEKNPITIEWTWDEAYANATASVEVDADGTYFNGNDGMILTANGTEIAQENGVFALDAGTYELKLATPVGAFNNPEIIENIDGYTDTNSLEANADYNYTWTATEDGTVILDITDGANITVNKVIEISEDGWPVTEQFELATPEVDENYNNTGWTVAENLAIEVVAGQQLNIQVNGLTDWATWTTPAIEYTLTGAFEPAEPAIPVDAALTFYKSNKSGGDLMLGDDIRGSFIVKLPTDYSEVYVEITMNGETTKIEKNKTSGKYWYFAYVVAAPHMTQDCDVVAYGYKDGTLYKGEAMVWSVRDCAVAKLDVMYPSYTTNATAQKQCDLFASLLNYGAEAQKQFSINLDKLATDNLAPEYAALIKTETPTMVQSNKPNETGMLVTQYSTGLMLQEKVMLSMMFKVNKSVNIEDCSVEVKHTKSSDGQVVTYTIGYDEFYSVSGSSTKYATITFAKLASPQLRDVVEFTFMCNGQPISATYVASAENICAAKLAQFPSLVPAIMNYGDCAKAVFG